MDEAQKMNIGLAQQVVEHRLVNKETWKETVALMLPDMQVDSVRTYVNKYLNGKVKIQTRTGDMPNSTKQINYHVLTEAWI